MGVTDYGVTPAGNGYSYSTPVFQASANIRSLVGLSSSSGPNFTFQLNVVVLISGGGSTYSYWIQDVAFIDTSLNGIVWEDNVWNLSAGSSGMKSTSISGNGSVLTGFGVPFYGDAAFGYPGSGVQFSEPKTITARVVASNISGVPHVGFQYEDGYGWQTFDNVTFPFLASAVTLGFHVDGFQYLPSGSGYYDAEWVLCGPGNGLSQRTTKSDMDLALSYWNGHNLQLVRAAYNHGADTAESVSNIATSLVLNASTGGVLLQVRNGSGTVGAVYGPGGTSTLRVASPDVASATIRIAGVSTPFRGGAANFTLAPGPYEVDLLVNGSLGGATNVTLAAGEFLSIVLTLYSYYPVSFVSTGLPAGTTWGVTVGALTLQGAGASLSTAVRNGSYGYQVTPVPGYHLASYAGTVSVLGGPVQVSLPWVETVYIVGFLALNRPAHVLWNVTVAGQPWGSVTDTINVTLPNGTYAFAVGAPNNLTPSPQADTVTVAGGDLTVSIGFSLALGVLRGSVAPSEATVFIDGSAVPVRSGVFSVVVPPGSYVVTASLGGYRDFVENTSVPAGATVTLHVQLVAASVTPRPGSNGTTPFGIDGIPAWEVELAAFAVAVAVAVAALYFAGRRRRAPPRNGSARPAALSR
jgi:hypothetical protein